MARRHDQPLKRTEITAINSHSELSQRLEATPSVDRPVRPTNEQNAQPQPRANTERDGTVSPYLGDASVKVNAAQKAVAEAQQAVHRLYAQSDPKQQKVLDGVEVDLIQSERSLSQAREQLPQARPDQNSTLAKNGQSQFNAASRGDPRAIEPQVAQQMAPPKKPEVVTISASPEMAKDTPLERQRGVPKQEFSQAHDNTAKQEAKPTIVESEQVKNTQIQPGPRPSWAGPVDEQTHLNAKSKDHQASRRATEKHQSQNKEITPAMADQYQSMAALNRSEQSTTTNNSQ